MIHRETTDRALNRFHRSAEEIKEAVKIEDVAREYLELKPAGANRLEARCPHPDHPDRTPSFTIDTNTQRFRCYGIGCQIHGDVIDLEQLCGDHAELWTSVVALSVRYGVELVDRRSETCKRWQRQKLEIEDLAERVRSGVRARRLFKATILNSPEIVGIEDPRERAAEVQRCWREFDKGLREVSR